MLDARVRSLFLAADGRLSGLTLERPDGASEELGARAIVLASCGFGGNSALVAQHIPEMATARYFGHEGNRGDAVLWGQQLGAALGDMSAYQGLGTLAHPQAVVVPHPLLIEGGWLVNQRGERFTHELDNISGMCVPVLQQPEGIAWVIFDARLNQACLLHSVEQRQLEELGAIRQANSWQELAELCQLPPDSLLRLATEVADLRLTDLPDSFGRRFADSPRLTAPFCALRVTGALFHTQGGLVIDAQARVARVSGGVIANLFAGGGAARSISGPAVTGYLPAVGLCMAITLGRLAGNSAAQYARETL